MMDEYSIKSRVVGVEISNARTTYAIVDIRGNILAEETFDTSEYPNVDQFVSVLSEKIITLVEAREAVPPGTYTPTRSMGEKNSPAVPPRGVFIFQDFLSDAFEKRITLACASATARLSAGGTLVAAAAISFAVAQTSS